MDQIDTPSNVPADSADSTVVITVEVTVQAVGERAEQAAARQWLADRIGDLTGLPVVGSIGDAVTSDYAVVAVAFPTA
jgi:hypothetical protein